MVSSGGTIAKLVLFLVSTGFILLAMSLITIGVIMLVTHKSDPSLDSPLEHDHLALDSFPWLTMSMVYLTTGITLAIICFLAIIATIFENIFLLNSYSCFLLVCSCVLVGLNSAFWVASEQSFKSAQQEFGQLVSSDKRDAIYVVQSIQLVVMCCGEMAPYDWHNLGSNANWTRQNISEDTYPSSCCGKSVSLSGESDLPLELCPASSLLYREGCFSPKQFTRFKVIIQSVFALALLGVIALLSIGCCLEHDVTLHRANITNLEYSAHMNRCVHLVGAQSVPK